MGVPASRREYQIEFADGQLSRHCLSELMTIGASGISRLPAFDFGGPMRPQRLARWRTWITPFAKSTSRHGRPRNSPRRIPVKIAVMMNGRQRGVALSMSALSSAIDGKSTPARSGPLLVSRSFTLMRTPRATFWATKPRPWANEIAVFRLVMTFLRIAVDRPASRNSLSKEGSTRLTPLTHVCDGHRPRIYFDPKIGAENDDAQTTQI